VRIQPQKQVILLISADEQWRAAVEEALAPLAGVHSVDTEEKGLGNIRERLVRHEPYEIIIVDVGAVGDRQFPSLVRHIRRKQREARIVVASAAPTWRQAKNAFQSGAIDYVWKSLEKKELLTLFQEVLRKRLPPWQPDLPLAGDGGQ
jgi:DNA-binding NtrC family response regulator